MSKSDDVCIWLPVYIGEMLAMTTRLNTEQIGALHLLMMDYWKNGVIPHDDTIIAAITGLSKSKSKCFITLVLSIGIFQEHEGSLYSNYLDDKKQQASTNKKTKSERAKKAADARWHKNTKDNKQPTSIPQASDSSCSGNAYKMLEVCPLSSSSSKSSLSHSAAKMPGIKNWIVPSQDEVNKCLKQSAPHVPQLNAHDYEQHVTTFKNYYSEQELLGRPILTHERRCDVLIAWIGNDNKYRRHNKKTKEQTDGTASILRTRHKTDNAFEQAANYVEHTQQSVDALFAGTA